MTRHWNRLLRRRSEWKDDGTNSFVSSQMNESCFQWIHVSWLIDSLTELYAETLMWAHPLVDTRESTEEITWAVKRFQKSWAQPLHKGEDWRHWKDLISPPTTLSQPGYVQSKGVGVPIETSVFPGVDYTSSLQESHSSQVLYCFFPPVYSVYFMAVWEEGRGTVVPPRTACIGIAHYRHVAWPRWNLSDCLVSHSVCLWVEESYVLLCGQTKALGLRAVGGSILYRTVRI